MADEPQGSESAEANVYLGVYREGRVKLMAPPPWEDGTTVEVRVCEPGRCDGPRIGPVIVAGFGLAGRWIADIFDRHGIDYVVIELNPKTVEAQRKLGRPVIEGDVTDPGVLRRAGIERANILAVTIPNEQAVLAAVEQARRLKPGIYIVARTLYNSTGLQARQRGADAVIKAEQAVARQFYEMLLQKVAGSTRQVGALDATPGGNP